MKGTSHSPEGPWVKQPKVVPFRCKPGTYYSHTASPGHIIRQGGQYLQFFCAATETSPNTYKRTIGIARTRNLNGRWKVDAKPILPLDEQVENSSLYYQPQDKTWFLFTNHVGMDKQHGEYTDAIWVYWSKNLNRWDRRNKAVVLDGSNSNWSKRVVGLPSVIRTGDRLAIFYDGVAGEGTSHVGRDIGLAWLDLPIKLPTGE